MMKYGLLCLLIPCVVYACDPPFEQAGLGCYYYSADQGFLVDSFDAAEAQCESDGGHLAYVTAGDENTAIVEHFLGSSITEDKVLLGARLNEDEVFEWLNGDLVSDGFDDAWAEGQPSGNGGCMGYSDEHEFAWDDFQCDDYIISGLVVAFMCEKPSDLSTTTGVPSTTTSSHSCPTLFEAAGEGCYYYSSDRDIVVDNYDAAVSQCQNEGGDLAIVTTGAENTAIVEHFFGTSITDAKVLLGARLNEDEVFEWHDGSLVSDSFDNWDEDQPSGNGECMGYSDEHEFEWDDFQCEDYIASQLIVGYICEAAPSSTNGPTTTSAGPPTTTTTVSGSTTSAVECTDPFVDTGNGCFYLLDQTDDFWTGNNNCITLDAHLAYITSLEKQLAMEQYFLDIGFAEFVWIGAFDTYGNDTFYWLDGVSLDSGYTNYYTLNGGDLDALYTHPAYNWEWNDATIDSEHASLCERDITPYAVRLLKHKLQ